VFTPSPTVGGRAADARGRRKGKSDKLVAGVVYPPRVSFGARIIIIKVTTCVFISILCQFVESGVGCCVVLLGVWLPDAFDLNPVSQELAEW